MGAALKGLRFAVAFLTRIPTGSVPSQTNDLAKAVPWFPVVGSAVGGLIGVVYWAASSALPALTAAALAVAAGLLLTGALHEDGLADLFDGLGAGGDRARSLEAMNDSRLGTYGVAALVMGLMLRVSLVAGLEIGEAVPALIGVHAMSRGVAVSAMGLKSAGQGLGDSFLSVVTRNQIGSGVVAALGISFLAWRGVAALIGPAAFVAGWLIVGAAHRRLGGITGDVLGASQQVAELAALSILVAL